VIGILPEHLDNFICRKIIYTTGKKEIKTVGGRITTEDLHMMSYIVQDKNSGDLQLLSKGDAELVLTHCASMSSSSPFFSLPSL
jgi:hypothetical protein